MPVAASAVGGLPELVDDEGGTLFPPGDPEALANGIRDLVSRGSLTAKGQAARRRVIENWSNDRLVERHLEIYEQLVRESPHG